MLQQDFQASMQGTAYNQKQKRSMSSSRCVAQLVVHGTCLDSLVCFPPTSSCYLRFIHICSSNNAIIASISFIALHYNPAAIQHNNNANTNLIWWRCKIRFRSIYFRVSLSSLACEQVFCWWCLYRKVSMSEPNADVHARLWVNERAWACVRM